MSIGLVYEGDGMKGIARLASELGISTGTVSRALNDKPDVNADTRARVLEAAQRMGYAPNASARNLAKGVTNSIGFMIELNPETASNSDNFFMGVFDGVQSVLRRHGLELLVLPCPTDDDPYLYLQRFVARDTVDAMIISATQKIDRRIDLLQARNIPFVALGRSHSGQGYSWIDWLRWGIAASRPPFRDGASILPTCSTSPIAAPWRGMACPTIRPW